MVDLLGGEIAVKSVPGEGSCFYFDIWVEVAEGLIIETNREHAESIDLKGLKVLLAEDNEMNIMVGTSFLQMWGVEFAVARNGAEAFKLFQENEFDLILMDLQMPVMDGFEATRSIRELDTDHSSNIPIIALTASTLSQSRNKVFDAGMNDFVTKPFRPEDLLGVLQNAKSGLSGK